MSSYSGPSFCGAPPLEPMCLDPPFGPATPGREDGVAAPESSPFHEMPFHLLYETLCNSRLGGRDLAALEATCFLFRKPASLLPFRHRSVAEMVAYERCRRDALFRTLPPSVQTALFLRCQTTWKKVLRFLNALSAASGTSEEWGQISSGLYHNVAVTKEGGVYTFGGGEEGCLGHGRLLLGTDCWLETPHVPRSVAGLRGIKVTQVSAGSSHTVVATEKGEVYTFGLNQFGCCGLGVLDRTVVHSPQKVEGALSSLHALHVAAGAAHTVVATSDGQLFSFGRGVHGRLGLGTEADEPHPRKVEALAADVITDVSAGVSHTLVVSQTGHLYSFGYGLKGRLGHGGEGNELLPRVAEGLKEGGCHVIRVAAGPEHSVALTAEGRVFTWGGGWCGCLGHICEENEYSPREVERLEGVLGVQVVAGKRKTFVLDDSGQVWVFGWNGLGSLGQGEGAAEKVSYPVPANGLKRWRVKQVAAGLYHTLAMVEASDGQPQLVAFGDNEKGQLGFKGDQVAASSTPLVVESLNLDPPLHEKRSSFSSTRYGLMSPRKLGMETRGTRRSAVF